VNWLGVHMFKECFEEVLQSWLNDDYMDAEMAREIGEMILYKNFERLYLKQSKGVLL